MAGVNQPRKISGLDWLPEQFLLTVLHRVFSPSANAFGSDAPYKIRLSEVERSDDDVRIPDRHGAAGIASLNLPELRHVEAPFNVLKRRRMGLPDFGEAV
ncbi:MAG: hypothetical protein WAN43_19335 [Rhodomicrobium sp.]